jgi:hypothetical protein
MDNSKFSKRSLLVLSMAALLAVGGVAAVAGGLAKAPAVEASDTTYTFTMDKDHLLASNVVKIGSTDYKVWLSNDKYTAGTTTFGTILSGGYLVSCNPLYGIKSITANLASGSMRANFSNEQANNWARRTCINQANFVAGTSSSVAIEGAPDYFYLEFTSDTVVNSISIKYTCNAIAEPTQETNDLLDFGKEAEGLTNAGDLSWAVSTSMVATGSVRSHHIFAPASTTDKNWRNIMIQLATPVAVTTTGHFSVTAYADTGSKPWLSFKTYNSSNSSWVQFGTELGGDYSVGSWTTFNLTPTAAGTVALLRIAFNTADSTSPLSVYIDNVQWVAA